MSTPQSQATLLIAPALEASPAEAQQRAPWQRHRVHQPDHRRGRVGRATCPRLQSWLAGARGSSL